MSDWQTKAFKTMLAGFGIPVEQVFDQVKAFATNGTLEKIVAFGTGLELLNAQIAEQNRLLRKLVGESNDGTIEGDYRTIAGPGAGNGRAGGTEGAGIGEIVSP